MHRFQESEEEVWQSELDPLAEALVVICAPVCSVERNK